MKTFVMHLESSGISRTSLSIEAESSFEAEGIAQEIMRSTISEPKYPIPFLYYETVESLFRYSSNLRRD